MANLWDNYTDSGGNTGTGGAVAMLGEVNFEVSSLTDIMTIDEYNRSVSANYAEHKIIGKKSLLEFTGAGLQEVTFSIKISIMWGHNPRTEFQKLVKYCEDGEVLDFVLGTHPVGDNKWVITQLSEKADSYFVDGQLLSTTANVTLKEYVENEAEKQNATS